MGFMSKQIRNKQTSRYIDRVERDIKEEKEHGKELDAKIQEWERKLRTKRREVGGTNAGSNFSAQSKKQEKVLENRLDHVIKRKSYTQKPII